jgi:hypothetical protein
MRTVVFNAKNRHRQMKYLPILILSLLTSFIYQTNETDIDNLFESHWVVNNENSNFQDLENFEFIIYNSFGTENLPDNLKYAGLTFQQDGTLIEHVWNRCVTGNPPDHFKADFRIEEIGNVSVIKISNSRIWDGDYILESLTETNLKLKRKK